jgi:peptidoglycan/xylan/chitin deacetylase (PgdA/CDA1 family)
VAVAARSRSAAAALVPILSGAGMAESCAPLPRPARAVHSELARASDAIHAATGVHPALFRAPYGAWSPAVIRQCEQMSMVPLDWSVDPRDWAQPGARAIAANIRDNTRPGSIILEHDGGGNRSQTIAALRIVLPRLLHEGYHFQTP